MTEPHTPTPAEWAAHWKRVGPMLEARRREELRNMTDEEAFSRLASLFEVACLAEESRTTSGLVEMRRLFDRGHRESLRSEIPEDNP